MRLLIKINRIDDGISIDEVQVGLQFTTIHAGWLVEFYNHLTTSKGKEIIDNGWKAAGISGALELGSSKMPSIDPFHDIDPMLSNGIEQPDDSEKKNLQNQKGQYNTQYSR